MRRLTIASCPEVDAEFAGRGFAEAPAEVPVGLTKPERGRTRGQSSSTRRSSLAVAPALDVLDEAVALRVNLWVQL